MRPDAAVFVGLLPPIIDKEKIKLLFESCGQVTRIFVPINFRTKQSKGVCFVWFADAEAAQRAKREMNGAEYEGRKIRVEEYKP